MRVSARRLGKPVALVLLGSAGCATEIEAHDQIGLYANSGPELRRSSLDALASSVPLSRTPAGAAWEHGVAPVREPVLQLVRLARERRVTKLTTSISAARPATQVSCGDRASDQGVCSR